MSKTSEQPILFSGPMVKAIIDDRKTMTRRVIDPQPDKIHDGEPYWYVGGYRVWEYRGIQDVLRKGTHNPLVCPKGKPGGRLWIKETFYAFGFWQKEGDRWSFQDRTRDFGYEYRYQSTDAEEMEPQLVKMRGVVGWHCRPSIFMSRDASRRISLEITDIRVERLNEISEEDAKAEGVGYGSRTAVDGVSHKPELRKSYVNTFSELWDKINGKKHPWSNNDWIWVIGFQKVGEQI